MRREARYDRRRIRDFEKKKLGKECFNEKGKIDILNEVLMELISVSD